MDQIDTSLYKDFTINKKYFKDSFIYTLGNEIRDTCDEIHRKQYKQLSTLFITLCIESHDRYYFNILSMITLFYHLHVEHEIYAMSYKNKEVFSMNIYLYKMECISGMILLHGMKYLSIWAIDYT